MEELRSFANQILVVMFIGSEKSGVNSPVPVIREYLLILKAMCGPRRNRRAFWAFCSSKETLFLKFLIVKIFIHAVATLASNNSKLELLIAQK